MRAPADWKVVVLVMPYITLPANTYLALGLSFSIAHRDIAENCFLRP